MSGTPANASVWADADVYIATDLAAVLPADAATAFSGAWSLVGLLDGGDGFEEQRDQDQKDFYAWGGILVTTSRRNFKLTKKFSVLEDNATTRSIVWPGSTSATIVVPRPVPIKIAFETRTGGKVRRLISRNYAMVDVDGSIKDSEEDLTKVGLVATIFPDAAGVLFDVQGKPVVTSLAITPLTLAYILADDVYALPLTATATYSDATTAIVSSQAAWSSATPAKATVDGRYVTGVAAGTSNVTCAFGGVTSTAPCVVTVS